MRDQIDTFGRRAMSAIADVLFPRVCALCGVPNPGSGETLCDGCVRSVDKARNAEFCRRCGATVGPYGGTAEGCPACLRYGVPLAGITRVGEFSGDLAELLRAFKFRGADHLDRYHGDLLGRAIRNAPWYGDLNALTYVPTCWQHRLTRRSHAASALAPYVARHAGLPLLGLLRRVRGGPHQVGLAKTARIENVKGKFAVARGLVLRDAVVCLLDDVTTTGATLYECARVLKRAGAAKVYAAVIAHAGGSPRTARDA
jgi:predicted amidophosphoribosyltransferase